MAPLAELAHVESAPPIYWYYQFEIFGEQEMLEKDALREIGGFPLGLRINLV